MARGDLSDAEWESVEPFSPVGERGPVPDPRWQFNAVMWRLRAKSPWRDVPEDTANSETTQGRQDPAPEPRPSLKDMLGWGDTNGADALCRVTTDPDPDRRPVAVWARQGGGRRLYECGMVEFLLRLLQGDFDKCPISTATLWGAGAARLLNFRDEERFLDEGVDAWTGMSIDPSLGAVKVTPRDVNAWGLMTGCARLR
ncbi:transposase [Streptomyces sp. P9-A2]|uniref:transposase n=1 Tax=Streptomyces sp. P9-A2 TaxID=3072284 RepID=UPI003FCCD453